MDQPVQRTCFLMYLKPTKVQDYLRVHNEVWPEMLQALRRAGWRNYSLFVEESAALVVGYCETADFDASLAAMEAEPVNGQWQQIMSDFFVADASPDKQLHRLKEYFHLA